LIVVRRTDVAKYLLTTWQYLVAKLTFAIWQCPHC
jgi:hypothetical protein